MDSKDIMCTALSKSLDITRKVGPGKVALLTHLCYWPCGTRSTPDEVDKRSTKLEINMKAG